MEFLQACFAENRSALICSLKFAGFSHAQAEEFLPATASCFESHANDRKTSQTIAQLLSSNPAQILHYIDLVELARKLRITPGLVRYGLNAIEPQLAEIMSRQKQGIVDVVISLAWEENGQLSAGGIDFFNPRGAQDRQREKRLGQ